MNNPFETIDARLSNIESLLLDIKHHPKPPELPDRMTLDEVCVDFNLTKPFVYKETSVHGTKGMPCKRFGSRLVFSRKEILQWMAEQTISKTSPGEIVNKQLQKSAKKKLR
jgi:hypothetical protein